MLQNFHENIFVSPLVCKWEEGEGKGASLKRPQDLDTYGA